LHSNHDSSIDNENERINSIASSRYDDDKDNTSDEKSDNDDGDDDGGGGWTNTINPTTNLYPITLALRYQTWRTYYEAVLDQYYKRHPEWNKVKAICGIDASEVLIYSEQAMVHAEFLPKWGTLFLTQRYIIFYESGTRNHYVARLGAVIDVCKGSIGYLMRDVFELYLMSDSQSALKGITSVQKDTTNSNGHIDINSNTNNNNSRTRKKFNQDKLIPQHIEKNMQKFTNGDKPLIFSFSEFLDTAKRDKWVLILKEVIAAHKLHFSMQFGEEGRTSPLLRTGSMPITIAEEGQKGGNSPASRVITAEPRADLNDTIAYYYYSPFQNEPSPPLLVIAAHANVARFHALKELVQGGHEKKKDGNGANVTFPEDICLLFSNANKHAAKIRWYVDSVRKHNRANDKSFIERLVNSIRSNIDANIRVYSANDDRPFDLQILATGIGRFADLCTPVVRVVQYCNHLFQWENPPATILAILICVFIAKQGLISYIPALALLLQVLFVIEIRMKFIGIFGDYDLGSGTPDEMIEQQRNFFQMLGHVHDGLQAAQNVITRANVQIGKFQTLFLWRTHEWRTWAILSIMGAIMLVFLIIPVRILFMVLTFFLFGKHFLPPSNPFLEFWDSIPSHVELTAD